MINPPSSGICKVFKTNKYGETVVLIHDILSKITTEYLIEKKKTTKNNALHRWITYDNVIPESLTEILGREKLTLSHKSIRRRR